MDAYMKNVKAPAMVLAMAIGLVFGTGNYFADQQIAFVDSEYILEKIPEAATVEETIDRLAQDWQAELDEKRKEIDDLFKEYQARELLYTNEERKRKREAIVQAEQEVERLRMRYFGPEGELFRQQDQLMRPIQERVLEAIEEVATKDGFDYIFDRSGDFLFLYAREQNNVSDQVLEELGIDVENQNRGGAQAPPRRRN